ncbi:MAG: MBL fold metallo-hydrolase [Acidobacteriaceae bacterium]|nr:MBL fold metallo-hydrolase [Acidobacteriaceae bacterium]
MRFLLLLLGAALSAQDTRVVLLGTGTPNQDPDRSGPAVAVISAGHVYIVDAGQGVVRRAAQAHIDLPQITRAFITHLHSDHTVGLPDLMLTPAVLGRSQPFEIYGPPGLQKMVDHLLAAYEEDRNIRLHGLEPANPRAYDIHAHDVHRGEIYRDSTLRVTAIAVAHGSWKFAFAYRFDAADKSIVISGDTTYSPALIHAAKGCDILVHEVYSQEGWKLRTPDWQRYHAAFHTSGPDLGRLAAQVRPRKLVLYHQLPMGQTPEEVVSEVKSRFSGEVIYGNDLDVIR